MSFDPYEFDRSYAGGQQESLGQYTAKTFLWTVVGLLVTFGVGAVGWATDLTWIVYRDIPGFQWILLVVTLVLSFTMAMRIERMSVGTAVALYLAMAALFGFTVSLYMYEFQIFSLMLIFLVAAVYFAVLAAFGYVTKADLSGLRPILFSGLLFLILFYVVSLFIPGLMVADRMICMIGVALFLAYTAYDTRRIREFYVYYSNYPDMLAKASIFSALQLYLDFLNLFIYLVRILGRRKN